MKIQLDMYQTLAVAVLVLLLGNFLKKRINFLEKFCIPSPVIGGLLFAIMTCICYTTGIAEFSFDDTLREVCMVFFFTSVGFQANLKVLKSGGKSLIVFLGLVIVLILLQNVTAVGLAKALGLDPLIGMCTGSIPMVGGHGTAGAFGPVLEEAGAAGAFSVAIASATFGLVAGCLIGGPVAKRLLQKYNLKAKTTDEETGNSTIKLESDNPISEGTLFDSVVVIALAMGIGACIPVFSKKLGLVLPGYLGPMVIAAIIRNIADAQKKTLPMKEISIIGSISLSLFLSMALMSMKLWELAALALPLIVILLIQTVIMALFAYHVTFRMMGKDYDAAVLATGHCGFGLGATPNAMANMETFTSVNGFSAKAFFVLPLVGSLFIDFVNASIITFFMNIFK